MVGGLRGMARRIRKPNRGMGGGDGAEEGLSFDSSTEQVYHSSELLWRAVLRSLEYFSQLLKHS